MTPQEKVIWTENATTREQVLMLRILNTYGKKFSATHAEIAKKINVEKHLVAKAIPAFKQLGWIENKRMYNSGKERGVTHCDYKITV